MIIQTRRYKAQKYRHLVNYILSDRGRIQADNTFTICHNLRSTDTEEIIQEFIENNRYRKNRKRGVVAYHEMLTFSPKDSHSLNLEILEDISRKYIELRGDRALCLAVPHLENKSLHVHFCFSGTEYRSAKTLRLDNKAFRELRVEMERFQQERYPELKNSLVYLNAWEKTLVKNQGELELSAPETQMKKRTGKTTNKEQLSSLVQQCFQGSASRDDFYQKLLGEGLELYHYRNKVNGLLWNGRKYRFRTLTLTEIQLSQLQKGANRMAELQRIMSQKKLGRGLER